MKAAPRDEEKKLLLSALASVPDKRAAEAIRPYLSDPKFQKEAGLAAMTLAEALRRSDRPAARELAQAVQGRRASPMTSTAEPTPSSTGIRNDPRSPGRASAASRSVLPLYQQSRLDDRFAGRY